MEDRLDRPLTRILAQASQFVGGEVSIPAPEFRVVEHLRDGSSKLGIGKVLYLGHLQLSARISARVGFELVNLL
jgi:hypothetical protein